MQVARALWNFESKGQTGKMSDGCAPARDLEPPPSQDNRTELAQVESRESDTRSRTLLCTVGRCDERNYYDRFLSGSKFLSPSCKT